MDAKSPIKDESERIHALYDYEILDTAAEKEFDRITEIASRVCNMPISLISLVDKKRQWFKSRVGLEVEETSRDLSFCQYALPNDQLLEVVDATEDERFKSNALVISDPHIRYYAGLPLVDPNGYALGTLCVIDKVPRQLDENQKKILSLLRDEVVALIVNRKEKEKYKESEQKLKAFFDNSQSLMCTHDLEGNFITVNEAGAKILGYEKAEIETLSLFDIVPKVGHHNLRNYLTEIVKKGVVKGEMRTLSNNGGMRVWMFNNILQTNGSKHAYVIGNAVDITEQHYLEKDLKHAQAMLIRTGRVARVGGWEYTLKDGKIIWSEITREIHEVPADYEPDLTTSLNFYKEGRHRENIIQAVEQAISTGRPWDLELEIITFKGNKLWVRSLGNADFENGICVRLYGTFQDIDKRKRMEAESSNSKKLLEDVLEATSAVAIIATDPEGIISLFNKGAENLLGYSSEEMIGKFSPTHFHLKEEVDSRAGELEITLGHSVEGFRVFVETAELHGAEQREWTYIRKDGSRLFVSLAVTIIKDIEDKVVGYLEVATDISKIINQRQELEKAKILAEQASAAKSEFLANMSHEIRTPLNGIVGFTDLLTRTSLDHTQREYLGMVEQSTSLLLGIINDILDFSKIEAGKLDLDIEQTQLYELVIQLNKFFNIQIQAKGLAFHLNIASDVPSYIWTDALRIKQVLMNLLSNATKFTQKGKIVLNISVISREAENAVLRFSVQDTGIGIKEDKQAKIFEAFSQEDTSMTKRYGGTGLGLTISNRLLKMMGSELKLESTVGIGSHFFFDIHLRAVWGMDEWEELANMKTVLVVADDESERESLVKMLTLKKINTVQAKNGFEVLQMLMRGSRYGAILIMNNLPIMSGIDTVRKIQEKIFNETYIQPIIPIFEPHEYEAASVCQSLNIQQWLFKPVRQEDLYRMLAKVKS
ncbi:PAS domain S-box protein [Sphingobacterium prati]|uniref:PAS domain S-box protein n=1 Tax=Sphingobacterium prati TaxID=2737006 RepID=UPI001553A640|nr:PAS domain S-box protein [Sphingobacterium prati]NPE45715.1 PAS domain S-box protein [Sphingobacterium prati]